MKRYWKIISICLVTLLVIGTFYTQSSFAANKRVEIEFEKVSGNEDELKNVMLFGNYSMDYLYQPIQITSEETIDPSNQSFLRKLERIKVSPVFDDLVKQHRNFMRSKDLVSNYFVEDENLLAYANVTAKNYVHPAKDLSFDIEVLNKETKESTALRLDVPERENYNWMEVNDVQITDGVLKVITRNDLSDSGSELRIYTFDMAEKKLLTDETIISVPAVENGWSDVRVIDDYNSIHRNKYVLIKTEIFENERVQSGEELTTVANEFVVYDIENNQSKQLVSPEETLDSINNASAIFNSTIYIPLQSANGLEVHRYDIENEKWFETLTLDGLVAKEGEISDLQVMNGKLYAIHLKDNENVIFIGDIETGESLYEGKLKVKHKNEDPKDFQLYIYEIGYAR